MATLAVTVDASELKAILEDKINWEGDLEDDCRAHWAGMVAHVECIGCHCGCPWAEEYLGPPREGEEYLGTDTWYWSVTRVDPECPCERRTPEQKGVPLECTCEQLWHTAENSGYTTNGEGARRFAELVMRLAEIERITGAKLETRRVW